MNLDTVGLLGQKLDVFHSRYLPLCIRAYVLMCTYGQHSEMFFSECKSVRNWPCSN